MNRQLLQHAIDALTDIPITERNRAHCLTIADLHAALRRPEQRPVGWAVLDDTGVIYIHRHREKAEEWLNRGVTGRRVEPVYLGC